VNATICFVLNSWTVFGSHLFSYPHPEFADAVPGHTFMQVTPFVGGHDFQLESASGDFPLSASERSLIMAMTEAGIPRAWEMRKTFAQPAGDGKWSSLEY
jgi:hypothetical protein